MKRSFLPAIAVIFCFSLTFAAKAQTYQTLGEQIVFAVNQSFPDWKPVNSSGFQSLIAGTGSNPAIFGAWEKGEKRFSVSLFLLKSSDGIKQNSDIVPSRSVMPPNREVSGIGDRARLYEMAERVEIEFVKENISVSFHYSFTNAKKDENTPHYYQKAPKEEVAAALEISRTIADAIVGRKSFTACFNDFYKQPLPPETIPEEKLLAAAYGGETENIKNLILQKADLKYADEKGDTALHMAVRQGCFETIKTLVTAKIDVNKPNIRQQTPLMLATNSGDVEIVKLLLAAGANPQFKSDYGLNAATYALSSPESYYYDKEIPTAEDKIKILKILRDAGVNLTDKNFFNGKTLLIFYLNNRGISQAVMQALLSYGIGINEKDSSGETALFKAASLLSGKERTDIVKFLIKNGADVNLKNERGMSVLMLLKEEEKRYLNDKYEQENYDRLKETLNLLIEAGAKE